jgi:uncharacterized protein YjbJ (UPF0337 family)
MELKEEPDAEIREHDDDVGIAWGCRPEGYARWARSRVSVVDDEVWIVFMRFDRRKETERSAIPSPITKEHMMNQEQFGQFWTQLKKPLKAKWEKITDEDLREIEGNLATFGSVLQKRYGEAQKDEVMTWVNRRYATWTGNYVGAGYQDAEPKAK